MSIEVKGYMIARRKEAKCGRSKVIGECEKKMERMRRRGPCDVEEYLTTVPGYIQGRQG